MLGYDNEETSLSGCDRNAAVRTARAGRRLADPVGAFIKAEHKRWGEVIRAAGNKLQ
jgi:hypothetical protein